MVLQRMQKPSFQQVAAVNSLSCSRFFHRGTRSPGKYRSADALHSQLQWSARGGGPRASRFALPRRASPPKSTEPPYGRGSREAPSIPISRVIQRMLADVGDALLGFCLGNALGLREREDSCVLPFIESRQQHDLAIGELERVMIGVKHAFVDLAKDRNGVAGIGTKDEGGLIRDWRLEREFGTRKYADSHRTILRRGESSCAGAEVVCDEFFADFGWACSHTVQTVVAHIKDLLSRKPPKAQC